MKVNTSVRKAILPAILAASCSGGGDDAGRSDLPVPPETDVSVPDFNADSAYRYVERQVLFGPRVPNTAAHDSCAAFLVRTLEQQGLSVLVQEASLKAFDNTILRVKNIIGSLFPEKQNRILLCAHWDTRPFADQDDKDRDRPIDGANDGGSGVGVLLEVARQLSAKHPPTGIDIVFFDAEDYGQPAYLEKPQDETTYCLGSRHWSANPHRPGYYARYGILLDMVGARNARFAREATSMYYAESVVNKVWNAAARAGYSSHFIYMKSHAITDDHTFINEIANIPAIDIIEHDPTTPNYFAPYWHTHDDNMSIIDRHTLKAVGQTLLEVIYREQ